MLVIGTTGSQWLVQGMRVSASYVSNTAYLFGGALMSANSTVRMDGDGIFINNSAFHGGGIFIQNGSDLIMEGNNIFTRNFAQSGGGAINVQDSWLSNKGHISFTKQSSWCWWRTFGNQ